LSWQPDQARGIDSEGDEQGETKHPKKGDIDKLKFVGHSKDKAQRTTDH
jgi:hypothetical protein